MNRWRLYFAHGRRQLRLGIKRQRPDRVQPEYRYIALEWQWTRHRPSAPYTESEEA